MYEVGLALAFRQPVEVILVRDDNESLLFDVSHIPVLRFDPMDEPGSVTLIRRVIEERLKERDLGGDLRVQKIVESLTEHELEITGSFGMHSHFGWKGGPLSAGVLAIPRLLEKGVLRLTEVPRAGNAAMYAWTPLGRVVADMVGRNRETLH